MKLDISQLGPRIAIIGNSNAGKSTLANRLAFKLNLPIHHLDNLRFEPGGNWKHIPKEVFLAKVDNIVKSEGWIIEGAYEAALPLQMQKATAVIHLSPSRWTCLYRYLRLIYRVKHGAESRIGAPIDGNMKFSWGMVEWILLGYPQDDKIVRHHLKGYKGNLYTVSKLKL